MKPTIEPNNDDYYVTDSEINKIADDLAESIEHINRVTPTTAPEWMD